VYCENGYVIDANGCQTCECKKDPVICPAIACAPDCSYDKSYSIYGCPTCYCNPCPKPDFIRTCDFGFQIDPKTGCQTSLCNEKPYNCYLYVKADANVNGTTSTGTATGAATTTVTATQPFVDTCALDCVNKYIKDENGCDTCACNPLDICNATNCVKPAGFTPIKCRDGSVTYVTEKCAKNADGVCTYQIRQCPLYLSIKLNFTLTAEELQKIYDSIIRYAGTIAEVDATIEKKTLVDGRIEYTIVYKRDALPADDASGAPIAARIAKDDLIASKGGEVTVLSDSLINTPSGFASLLVVPLLGALISLLF
jgi:hypothetical protein